MERQKILLVILSVSLFLIVVLAGSLFFFRPTPSRETGAPNTVQSLARMDFDPFEYVKGVKDPLELDTSKSFDTAEPEQLEIVIGGSEDTAETEVLSITQKQTPQTGVVSTGRTPPKPEPEQQSKRSTPAIHTVEEYWIQAASYKSRTRAENLQTKLNADGVQGTVTTRSIDGNAYYRVRIGPYPDKREAEKFLSWIRNIDGLEGSYISLVYTKKIASP